MGINQYQEDFSINEVGEILGREYIGVFTAKSRISHNDRFRSDQIKRSILGGTDPNSAGSEAQSMAQAFSQIAVRLVKSPDWWSGSNGGIDLPDFNVVLSVFTACMDIEAKAAAEVVKKAEAAKPTLDKPITPQV